jgi:murein DD-endopeptidase MepM/ murein hydrolase activator NlpD
MICFFAPYCDYFPAHGYRVKRYRSLLLVLTCPLAFSFPLTLHSAESISPDGPEAVGTAPAAGALASACARFDELNTRIRDRRIGRGAARSEISRALSEVRDAYYRAGGRDYPRAEWVFPLAGYDSRAISGGRRHGYIASGYDFFSGNRHGGHPSFDIFIRDRNRDSLDDRSGRPVKVLSMTGGVVVALENAWEPGSRLRGGKYLWIYDPASDLLVYYAHNGDLSVKLGDLIAPGDVLASVGRSGYNAAKRRSPTHLHLTALKAGDGMLPVNVYRELKEARSMAAM